FPQTEVSPVMVQPGPWHATEAEQVLGAVLIGCPRLSKAHATLALATAVPVTVTVMFVPAGHVTSSPQTMASEPPPAGTPTVAGTGLPWISVEQGKPLISTLRSA